jgi:hypothetical protein
VVLWLVLVQERGLPVKPTIDNLIHGQQVSLPTRQYALSGFWGLYYWSPGVQMTWFPPVFLGRDHNSDVTCVIITWRRQSPPGIIRACTGDGALLVA